MATTGSILTAPSTTLSTNTEWQNELGYTEAARYGYDGVSLTEWASGNTTKPEIAAGSVIEIDGAMCEYDSDTTLTDDGSLADGWCYIKHVVSGATITPTLTNTWGTWDTAKQGYYDGSGNRYSLFRMYRSGAITKIFTLKSLIVLSQDSIGLFTQGLTISGINLTPDVVAGNTVLTAVSDDTLSSAGTAEVTALSRTVPLSGTIRVTAKHAVSRNGDTSTLYFKKNGVTVNSWTNTTSSDVTRTDDITVVNGDLLEITHKCSDNSFLAYCTNRRLMHDGSKNLLLDYWEA